MSAFTGPLTLTHLDQDWRCWRLEQPLVYEVGELGSGRVIEVPAGFVTDGASVPRPLWALLPAWGSYSRAAVIHDRLCVLLHAGLPHPEAPTRREADAVFDEAMQASGVGALTRWALWCGARLGGFLPGRPPNARFD